MNPETGQHDPVGTPDSVQVITEFPSGARGIYHMSGVVHHGPGPEIHLYGSQGTLKYAMAPDNKLYFGTSNDNSLSEVSIPDDLAGDWRVEEEFINAIRGIEQIEFNDFAKGVRCMEFTKAVELRRFRSSCRSQLFGVAVSCSTVSKLPTHSTTSTTDTSCIAIGLKFDGITLLDELTPAFLVTWVVLYFEDE